MCGWKDKRKRGKGNVFRELVWVAMVALQECTRKVALRFSFEVASSVFTLIAGTRNSQLIENIEITIPAALVHCVNPSMVI